jgi:hypothetical protein
MLARTHVGEMRLFAVPPLRADQVLPMVSEMLAKGYRRSGNIWNALVLLDELRAERMTLWVAGYEGELRFIAAMVTRLYVLENGSKVCHIVALGGEGLRDWIKYVDRIADYARAEGCDTLRLEGREGWSRILPSFVRVGVILEQRIANDG